MKNTTRLYTALCTLLALSLAPSALAQNGQELCGPTQHIITIESITIRGELPAPVATPEPMGEIIESGSFTIEAPRPAVAAAAKRTHARRGRHSSNTTSLPTAARHEATASPASPAQQPVIRTAAMRGNSEHQAPALPPVTGAHGRPRFVVHLYRVTHPSERRFPCPPKLPAVTLFI